MIRSKKVAAVAALLLAAGGVFAASAPASAHNFIVSTTPGDGAVLTTLPERFEITTNDALLDVTGNANAFVFDIIDTAGLYYGDGCVAVAGATMATDAALGTAGDYTIAYQFVSADGHSVSGELAFTWDPAAGEPVSTGSAAAPECGVEPGPEPTVEPTEDPTAEPSTEPSSSAEPGAGSPQGGLLDELLWVGGAVAAVVVAVVLALALLRRRPPVE
ncbi:MAG: copper resistance protein CopC [Cryobacterium sp.]|nr:copper resistance protein CopC [Cryobacterium sp.]